MRKLVVLLTLVALVSSVMPVLAGCGSSAPADQPAAAPTETTSQLLKPHRHPVSAPQVDDSVSTPTPASSASDGIEFVPVDSFGTSGKQEPITVVDPDSPQKGSPGATGPVQGDAYTWQDGDRTMTGDASNRPGSREGLRRTAS